MESELKEIISSDKTLNNGRMKTFKTIVEYIEEITRENKTGLKWNSNHHVEELKRHVNTKREPSLEPISDTELDFEEILITVN